MNHSSLPRKTVHTFFIAIVFLFLFAGFAKTEPLLPVSSHIIADSEEPFNRRIYYYDMALDSVGNIHFIYAKPTINNAADVYYVRRINGSWQSEILLSSNGYGPHGATEIEIGDDDTVHVCYIKKGSPESLYYRTIANGVVQGEKFVESGGWTTRMQLDEYNSPIFIRVSQDFGAPGTPSKLSRLVTNNGGDSWSRSLLALPQVQQFRLADFVYNNGTYHITYGDFAHVRTVWNRSGTTENGDFHNFHYVQSTDGSTWDHHLIDDSGYLYELEFWTSLVLVDGRPLIGMYRYNQYGNIYNTGSYAIIAEWTGNSWQKKIPTDQSHPDLTEGMGVGLAVIGNGDYIGIWDFSPANTYDDDFRGVRGNIALVRSGGDGQWSYRKQVDPFSQEGKTVVAVHGNSLYFIALGDYVDSKIYFREYDVRKLLPPNEPPNPNSGNVLIPIYHLLLFDDK